MISSSARTVRLGRRHGGKSSRVPRALMVHRKRLIVIDGPRGLALELLTTISAAER